MRFFAKVCVVLALVAVWCDDSPQVFLWIVFATAAWALA
jgi:hypothetical protein